MLSFVTKRIEHVQFLLGESRWGLVLLVCWLLLGLFLLIRTSLFPISWQQETTVPFVPDISSDFWTSIFILLLFAAIVEGSYQATGELQERVNELEVKYSHRHEIPEIQNALRSFIIQGTELMSRCKDQTNQVSLQAIME
jgi:hypothetical protein